LAHTFFPSLETVAINTSSGNSRFTSLDGTEKRQKKKNESTDLDARARMMFAATAEIDESEKTRVSNEDNVPLEQMKDYLADVLEEIKDKKKPNEQKN
jgi:hypothetical protein